MVLAGCVVITASTKNSRRQKAILSTVYRGDKSTATTMLELLLAPVSVNRWSQGYLAVSLYDYPTLMCFITQLQFRQAVMRSPELSSAAFVNKKMKSAATVLALVP